MPLFANLPPGVFAAVLEFLKQRVKLIRAHPSQVIFREGDRADHFYMVRIGFVKVSRRSSGGERVANYIGPDEFFGEIGLLAQIPEIQRALEVSDIRTATCTALDHVDLVRIDGEDFHWLLRAFLLDRTVLEKVAEPFKTLFQRLLDEVARADRSANVADRIVRTARERLEQNRASQGRIESAPLEDFLQQGLMEASNLLVLDLEKCTRCDECVKACADIHHDPVPGNHVNAPDSRRIAIRQVFGGKFVPLVSRSLLHGRLPGRIDPAESGWNDFDSRLVHRLRIVRAELPLRQYHDA